MASAANPTGLVTPPSTSSLLDDKLAQSSGSKAGKWGSIVGGVILLGGLIYIGTRLASDLSIVHSASVFPYILLGLALMIALGFEFVNGFHDTANAVATVIYTHSLDPHFAVVWSGIRNFIGVLLSSGAVAFAVITLLPIELILRSAPAPASPWSLHCSSPPSSGTSHLVHRPACVELTHHHRLHHGRRHREPADARALRGSAALTGSQVTKVFSASSARRSIGFAAPRPSCSCSSSCVTRDPRSTRRPKAPLRRRSGFAAC